MQVSSFSSKCSLQVSLHRSQVSPANCSLIRGPSPHLTFMGQVSGVLLGSSGQPEAAKGPIPLAFASCCSAWQPWLLFPSCSSRSFIISCQTLSTMLVGNQFPQKMASFNPTESLLYSCSKKIIFLYFT